ncbi:carbonic anhydrase [Bdellovibrio reynosensis]|uniref:Carbonic anhydrase n=1 Tax=Bdellovibrio reynosensis TaxID=2835041 RepID=A0ABY4CBP7_9BACT|nr:carbonic anhydrase [Bdellovibrio reynosensis]UOF02209.1 carbonic anhydrase [Bdellovibrio reynosensis]
MLRLFIMSLVLLSMSACSSLRRSPSQEDTKVMLKDQQGDKKEAPAQATSNDEKGITRISSKDLDSEAQTKELKEAVAAATQHVEKGSEKSTRRAGPVAAEKAMGWLRNGNTRFARGRFRNDGASRADRSRLSSGQTPHSVIVSCSDSQVPPEVVFDQKLGEVFVIRTAGEAMDNNVVGSVEYAVEHLGANLVVIMGHDSCGAISATLASLRGSGLGSPALEALANDIKPRIQKFATMAPSEGLVDESWANTDGVAADLIGRSAILRDAIASGDVKIVKAMYHLDSGQVDWR